MAVVGIIGGGQLASMTAQAARSLGISIAVLPDSGRDPGIKFADYVAQNLTELNERSDVITFENEFSDLRLLEEFAQRGAKFLPSLNCLAVLVDKYQQRSFLMKHNLPVPGFTLMADFLTTRKPIFPVVIKTCRQGYDGKGTKIVTNLEELNFYWQSINRAGALVEPLLNFQQELAIMIARSVTGEISLFPIVETIQVNQVCRRVIAPARVKEQIKTRINAIATTIVNTLDYVGILGIEFFLINNDEILVNEMAPRPHNSGHYTIEACPTSQFSQLLRSVLGLPLGATNMTHPVAIMVNLLGRENEDQNISFPQFPQTYLHWYGKQSRPGRKLGHVTVLADDYDRGLEIATKVEQLWYS